MSEIWSLNTLCRCCHRDGTFKSLSLSYSYMGQIEIYADMLFNTFGIVVNQPSIDTSYSICDNCVNELRNASQFKKQVQECEIKFENYCKNELTQQLDIKVENVDDYEVLVKTATNIKIEACDTNDNYRHNIDDNASFNDLYDYQNDNCEEIESTGTQEKDNTLEKQRFDKSGNPGSETKLPNKIPRKKPRSKYCHYTCLVCYTIFKTLKALKLHRKKHSNPLPGNNCSKRFNRKNALERRNQTPAYVCNICGKTYESLNKMLDHKITHKKYNEFICDICKKMFSHKSTLRKHIDWHNGTNKKFMCDVCGNSFNDKSNLNIHFRTVHEKLKMFKCHLCPKKYAAKKALKVHDRTHTGERPYKCELCEKAFICSSTLNNHKKIHENIFKFGGKYLCKVCGAVYNDRGDFTAHTRSHIGVKPHKCVICNKYFTSHYSLKRHIESHDGIKRFSCDICYKKFCGKAQLQRHVRTLHDPNKIYKQKIKCDMCKMYVTDMEKHLKSHLSRALKCGYCPKTYSERNALNRHIKQTHSGVSYDCDLCGKKYVKLGSLRDHKMKKHNSRIKNEEKTSHDSQDNSLE